MKRRPKRRPDGRWQRRAKGKLFISSISQEDADRQAREYIEMIKQGMHPDAGTMTVGQYALAWLPRNKATECTDDVYSAHASRVDFLRKEIGDMLISQVRPSNIKDVLNKLDGLSKDTISKYRNLYTSIFESAVEDGYCRSNPCRSKTAKPPTGKDNGSHRSLEPWERHMIENTCKDHEIYPLAMLMLYTGLRPSEAMAINVARDVDFENNTITVNSVRRTTKNQAYISKKGKTPKSVGRKIPLFSPLKPILKKHEGMIVADRDGRVLSKTSWKSKWGYYIHEIEAIMNGHARRSHHAKKGDPIYDQVRDLREKGMHKEAQALRLADWKTFNVRPYDLRHEFCTWCCTNGVEMHTLIEWMGHKNFKMIQEIYDHVNAEREKKQIEKLESAIKSSQNSSQDG